jgi:cytochrome c-type biogenesis protein
MNKIASVLTLILLLVLTACGATPEGEAINIEPEAAVESTGEQPEENTAVESEAETASSEDTEEERTQAPEISLMDSEGQVVNLSDYKGKIVFVNFFTTWCTYCEQEMPEFQQASEDYEGEVVFLLVDVFTSEREDKQYVIDWYKKYGYTMPMIIDEEGAAVSQYPVRAFPTTYVVDQEGGVLGYLEGAMNRDMIDSIIDQMR